MDMFWLPIFFFDTSNPTVFGYYQMPFWINSYFRIFTPKKEKKGG